MQRKALAEAVLVLAALVTATALTAFYGADLALSSRFFIGNAWPVGNEFPWKLLYRIDRIPAILLALAGLAAAAGSFLRPEFIKWRKAGVFLALFMLLGPGLLVNTVFKDGWGRPRPREITQFGGSKQFLHPWQKGVRGQGRSFPSGHASAAFFLIAPFFIYRRRRPRLARSWLTGGIIFGVLMSIARITQGGHFLSDNLWAFGMVYLTGLLLSAIMGLGREDTLPAASEHQQCSI
ncbi:MAG: phosphatase PAP2 family protein [Deltaproteobacteria bacterium]|nr:phosphatase PAP2 family protein [Deltaproteobacteria bacterium]